LGFYLELNIGELSTCWFGYIYHKTNYNFFTHTN